LRADSKSSAADNRDIVIVARAKVNRGALIKYFLIK